MEWDEFIMDVCARFKEDLGRQVVENEKIVKMKANRGEICKKIRKFGRLEGKVGLLKVWV